MYSALLEYNTYHDFFNRVINADVVRTVHDTDEKLRKEKMGRMERILQVFARRNPYVGYCQGMNFILFFIMTMQFDEEESFWILLSVVEEIVDMGYYTDMLGVAVDIKVVSYIFQEMFPKTHEKLTNI
jgi:hypothetical protein